MPELPEVETIRRDLVDKILHKKIVAVEVRNAKTVRIQPERFISVLSDTVFTVIDRIGKLLIVSFDNLEDSLLVHLKMTGQLVYRSKTDTVAGGHSTSANLLELPHKHTRVIITFADRSELFFNDLRLFGYMQFATPPEVEKIRAKYGIEPLTANFTLENFHRVFKNRKTTVKAILLNQNLIAGLGNIYADEACFIAGIRPSRSAAKLTSAEIVKLHTVCKKVIARGIKYRGTTFNNYVDSDGKQGNFLKFLNVYGRAGKICRRCKFGVIKKIRAAGRGTHFCAECQK